MCTRVWSGLVWFGHSAVLRLSVLKNKTTCVFEMWAFLWIVKPKYQKQTPDGLRDYTLLLIIMIVNNDTELPVLNVI